MVLKNGKSRFRKHEKQKLWMILRPSSYIALTDNISVQKFSDVLKLRCQEPENEQHKPYLDSEDFLDGECNISCKAKYWPSRAQHLDHRGSNERIGIRLKLLFDHGTRAWSRYPESARQSPHRQWKRLLFASQIEDRACPYAGSQRMARFRSWIVGRTNGRIKGLKSMRSIYLNRMNFITSMFWWLLELFILLFSPCLVFLADPLFF